MHVTTESFNWHIEVSSFCLINNNFSSIQPKIWCRTSDMPSTESIRKSWDRVYGKRKHKVLKYYSKFQNKTKVRSTVDQHTKYGSTYIVKVVNPRHLTPLGQAWAPLTQSTIYGNSNPKQGNAMFIVNTSSTVFSNKVRGQVHLLEVCN